MKAHVNLVEVSASPTGLAILVIPSGPTGPYVKPAQHAIYQLQLNKLIMLLQKKTERNDKIKRDYKLLLGYLERREQL